MNRRNRNKARFIADQATQSFADFSGSVAIVREHQYAVRIFPFDLHKIRNAMHQHPGFPRSGPREDQYIGLFTVVLDDLLLGGVAERVYDAGPGLTGRLPAELSSPAWHPPTHKCVTTEFEIVLSKPLCLIYAFEPLFRIGGHDMGLDRLLCVVFFKRLKVLDGELAALRV